MAQWLRAAGLPGRLGRQLNQRIHEKHIDERKKAGKLVRCTCRAAGYSFVTLTTLNFSRLFVIQVQRQQEQQHRIWHTQFHCSVVSPNIQGGPNKLHTLLQIYCRILPVEEFRKSVEIWQNYGHEFGAPFFGTPYTLNTVHAQLHPV